MVCGLFWCSTWNIAHQRGLPSPVAGRSSPSRTDSSAGPVHRCPRGCPAARCSTWNIGSVRRLRQQHPANLSARRVNVPGGTLVLQVSTSSPLRPAPSPSHARPTRPESAGGTPPRPKPRRTHPLPRPDVPRGTRSPVACPRCYHPTAIPTHRALQPTCWRQGKGHGMQSAPRPGHDATRTDPSPLFGDSSSTWNTPQCRQLLRRGRTSLLRQAVDDVEG